MKKISRREWLQWGLGATAFAMAPVRLWASEKVAKEIPIALQLYSIREDCRKDLPKMIAAVAQMGYQGVELMAGNFGADAKEFRKLLEDNGLQCCGTHTPQDSLKDENLGKTADYLQEIGARYLIVPWMNADTKEDWLKLAQWLSDRSVAAGKLGMQIGFHNHRHEMTKVYDGKMAWELIFENTPKEVIHQIDVGHCVHAGVDPVPLINKFAGRSKTVHIAEYGGGGIIGKGDVRWKEVLPALAKNGGTEWFIIECENKETPVQDAKDCFDGLKSFLS